MQRTHLSLPSLVLVAMSFAGSMACEEMFAPRSAIEGLRILALEADKFEVRVTDQEPMTITPFVVDTSSSALKHEWTFCPINVGGRAGFACAIAACEKPITAEPSGKIIFNPGQAALDCIQNLESTASPDEMEIFSGADQIPDQVETLFRYRVTNANGDTQEAIFRVPLWLQNAPEEFNSELKIQEIIIGGETVTSTPTQITLADLSEVVIETTIDQSDVEDGDTPVLAYFATQGRFSSELSEESIATTTLRIEQVSVTKADIYIVIRDLRGSQRAYGPITIQKP